MNTQQLTHHTQMQSGISDLDRLDLFKININRRFFNRNNILIRRHVDIAYKYLAASISDESSIEGAVFNLKEAVNLIIDDSKSSKGSNLSDLSISNINRVKYSSENRYAQFTSVQNAVGFWIDQMSDRRYRTLSLREYSCVKYLREMYPVLIMLERIQEGLPRASSSEPPEIVLDLARNSLKKLLLTPGF